MPVGKLHHPEFWYQNSLLFKSLGSVQFYFYFKNDSKYIYSIIINAVFLIYKIILRGKNIKQHSSFFTTMISEGSCDTEDWSNSC